MTMYCRQGQSFHGKFCGSVPFMYKLNLKTLNKVCFSFEFLNGVKFFFNSLDLNEVFLEPCKDESRENVNISLIIILFLQQQ